MPIVMRIALISFASAEKTLFQQPVRSLLVETAQAAAHTKHTYLAAQYHRLVTRRGKKKQLLPSVTPSS
jgi:hypothetical protein